jgi:hypothetical protein
MWRVLLVFGCLIFGSQASAEFFDCRKIKDLAYSSYNLEKFNREKAMNLSAAKDYVNAKKSFDAADDALEYSAHWATLYIAFCKD